ncbi:nucleotide exchange factor GrpE [Frigoribacterium sp. CG_9.8]|uniref:nucleotide exchange factor GrpE n=1 Tax=Frigoribacterium sp. CG_9.8 TaxID=2787733 RepID=UPI0018CB6223|nr:nucleotide exchange factor GrpE [Frigoribacterium sp. CG_9.8]MBG6108600.1 molecular chaperone GrpE [Frigoribacterium sp. CG_9.8]
MAANKNPKAGKGSGDDENARAEAVAAAEAAALAEGLIEAQGPDVETSFTDDDLAFLAGDPDAGTVPAANDPAAEILGDLKRVQAEFANYRKRVERDREANREVNIAEVVKSLLPVLDDLSLAEAHGDLAEGPMVVIVAKLRASLEKFGLTVVGEKGDVFDPHQHEALVQLPTPGVTVNTVADVIAPGYKLGERLLRPAKVAVAVPAE